MIADRSAASAMKLDDMSQGSSSSMSLSPGLAWGLNQMTYPFYYNPNEWQRNIIGLSFPSSSCQLLADVFVHAVRCPEIFGLSVLFGE